MDTGKASRRAGVAQAIDELDLGELGRAIWRRKRLILGATLATVAIAFAAVSLVTPRYKSEARVLIETRDNIFLRPDAEKSTERITTIDQEAVTSQVQLVLSRDLARKVVRELKLGELPEFDPLLRGRSVLRTILVLTGLVRNPMRQTAEERVLRSYFERLTAFQVEKSRVIAIEFESQDPKLAARVANTIARNYLVLQQAAKQEQSRMAGQWLAGEIDRLRRSVAEAEAKVEAYRAKTNLFIGSNNTMLPNQQLGDVNAQLAAARAQKADAESKAKIIRDALRRGGRVEFSDIINSELLRRLSEQYATLQAQLAEQSSTLLERHPRIKELRAQIAGLERQMRSEADRLARSLENDAKLASARVEALRASLDQLKQQAASSNEHDVQLRALEREAKSQRDLLESYLAKYREASARNSIGAASPDARIISRAIVSNTPSWPKKLPTILIAGLGVLTLSLGFVVTGQLLASGQSVPIAPPAPDAMAARARAAEETGGAASRPPLGGPAAAAAPAASAAAAAAVQAGPDPAGPASAAKVPGAGGRPIARLWRLLGRSAAAAPSARRDDAAPSPAAGHDSATVPQARPREPAPALDNPQAGASVPLEGIAELVRSLAASAASDRRIAVIGERKNIGTTLTAITLARALARQGRVVLVELALASPNLSVIAGDPQAPGIGELVRGTASFGQVITRDRYSCIHVITAGRDQDNAAAVMASPRLAITLEALGRSYDYVVVDGGALPDISVERLAQLARRAVLLAGQTTGPTIDAARAQLLAAGFPVVNVLAGQPRGPQSTTGGKRAAA